MAKTRAQALFTILKGFFAATGLTLALMACVAAALLGLRISDGALTAINQVMKVLSILLGVLVAVGRGGKRGFLTGMTIAMLYMAAGYAGYVAFGGSAFNATQMLGEILIGAAIGAVSGAVLANWER